MSDDWALANGMIDERGDPRDRIANQMPELRSRPMVLIGVAGDRYLLRTSGTNRSGNGRVYDRSKGTLSGEQRLGTILAMTGGGYAEFVGSDDERKQIVDEARELA